MKLIEVDMGEEGLMRGLVDAVVASELSHIIKEQKTIKHELKEDRKYWKKLAKAADFVLEYYTTPEMYKAYTAFEDDGE